jgi:hypothetical protein
MSRQNFQDLLADPPLANLTAVVATTETALWNAGQFTPIPAGDAKTGKMYEVSAGGVMSWASTGTLLITPRFGLTVGAGITMGANPVAQTTPGATTNSPWRLKFTCIVRAVGAPGINSTVIGEGEFISNGIGTLGTGTIVVFGGTPATVDVSISSGITIGWTLSVAGTITPHYAYIQSLN